MRVLHQECRKHCTDGIRIICQTADFSTAVNELAAFFVDAEQNELEMLFTGGLVNETQKIEFAFTFGGKAAPRIASRDEQNLAEILDRLCLERGGECVQAPTTHENSLIHFVDQELAENRLRHVIAVGKFLRKRQIPIRVEESLFPVR